LFIYIVGSLFSVFSIGLSFCFRVVGVVI